MEVRHVRIMQNAMLIWDKIYVFVRRVLQEIRVKLILMNVLVHLVYMVAIAPMELIIIHVIVRIHIMKEEIVKQVEI